MLNPGPWDLLSLLGTQVLGTQVSKIVGRRTADLGHSSLQQRLLWEKHCILVIVGQVGGPVTEVTSEEFGGRDPSGAQLETLSR